MLEFDEDEGAGPTIDEQAAGGETAEPQGDGEAAEPAEPTEVAAEDTPVDVGRCRQTTVTTSADIERWMLDAAASARPDALSSERLAKIIAAVRRRPVR